MVFLIVWTVVNTLSWAMIRLISITVFLLDWIQRERMLHLLKRVKGINPVSNMVYLGCCLLRSQMCSTWSVMILVDEIRL